MRFCEGLGWVGKTGSEGNGFVRTSRELAAVGGSGGLLDDDAILSTGDDGEWCKALGLVWRALARSRSAGVGVGGTRRIGIGRDAPENVDDVVEGREPAGSKNASDGGENDFVVESAERGG